ncbi:MAG: type II secretion system F family protein [Thermodesulfobacteriota bacterium]
MPTFRYKAYNNAGKTVAGDIDAAGARDAAERLKTGGLFPVEVTESAVADAGLLARLGYRGIKGDSVALATRQLSTLLATGSTLSEALEVLAENTEGPRLRSIILRVKEDVTGGSPLSAALGAYPGVFSPLYRGLVASGEATGSLDAVLARLADHLEARSRIVRDLWTAMTYPILMTLVGAGVLAFLFIFVIPKITRIFEDTETVLPWITVLLIWITGLVRGWWPVMLIAAGAALFAANRYRDDPRVRSLRDRLMVRLPVAGRLYTNFHVLNMTRTLGNLLRGGVPLIKALELTGAALGNTVFDRIIGAAREECAGGGSLSGCLRRQAGMPMLVVHMISVGERGGNLDEMLLKAADSLEAEFDSGLKRMVSLAEPLLLLAMGLVTAFIVLAILLPIFELNQVVR